VIQNFMGVSSQGLQIIIAMQSQRASQKRASKENTFFRIVKHVFFSF
jgi:hypothetical protein